MKIYYDSCQSMVALRKTTQAFFFLMQHITSRSSRLAPLKLRAHRWRPRPPEGVGGRTNPRSHRSLCTLASSSPGLMCGVWTMGGTVPAGCFTGPFLHRVAPLSSATCRPNKSSSCVPLDPVTCSRTTFSFFFYVHRLPCSSSSFFFFFF